MQEPNYSFYNVVSDIVLWIADFKELFVVDYLLKRTILLLSPVHTYAELFKTGYFSVVEICNTMRRMLPDTAHYTKEFVSEFIFVINVLFVLDLKVKLYVK